MSITRRSRGNRASVPPEDGDGAIDEVQVPVAPDGNAAAIAGAASSDRPRPNRTAAMRRRPSGVAATPAPAPETPASPETPPTPARRATGAHASGARATVAKSTGARTGQAAGARAGRTGGQDAGDADAEPEDAEVEETDTGALKAKRSGRLPARVKVDQAPPPPPGARMSDTERLYGIVLTGVLALCGVLMATVIHGKGAATHPHSTLPWIGVVIAAGMGVAVYFRIRIIAGFAAVGAAYLINSPKQVPNSIRDVRVVALVAPLAFAFWMMTKHRKYQKAKLASRPQVGAAERRAQNEARRNAKRRGTVANTNLPPANSRYTPPKPKRPRPPAA